MKIVIDARFWGPGHTGLGVYTRELVYALSKIDTKNKYTLLVREKIADAPQKMKQIVVDAQAYSFKEQLLVAMTLYKLRPDLVHFPSINVPILYFGKFIVTVHDLIKHGSRGPDTSTHNPALYWLKYLLYHLVFGWAVYKSSKILTPSIDVKNRLLAHYRLSPDKISVTYESSVLKPGLKGKYPNLPKKFAIFTGNAYPHKNLARLVKIWPKVYDATTTNLLISCGRSVFTDRIEKLVGNQKSIHFLGYATDDQLATIYPFAQCYVFPTLAEGFGIPALDAMVFSLPVVCSNIPVLKEIYGPAAQYFDPHDERDMTQKIISVLTNNDLRAKLISYGKTQVKKYSWPKTAQQTLEAYENCSGL